MEFTFLYQLLRCTRKHQLTALLLPLLIRQIQSLLNNMVHLNFAAGENVRANLTHRAREHLLFGKR